jgi:hypothetical protein
VYQYPAIWFPVPVPSSINNVVPAPPLLEEPAPDELLPPPEELPEPELDDVDIAPDELLELVAE